MPKTAPDPPAGRSPGRSNDPVQLLLAAGHDVESLTPEHVGRAERLLAKNGRDPEHAAVEALRAQRRHDAVLHEFGRTRQVLERLQADFHGLLDDPPLLGQLDAVLPPGERGPSVLCRLGGQVRELFVHPEVDLEALRSLRSWHYLCVHPSEFVVIGFRDGAELHARAMGEVVDYRGDQDRARGLVRVARTGQDEIVVRLAPHLADAPLRSGSRLVLQADDPRWAIAMAGDERPTSRFLVPTDSLDTRFEDLAGLDGIIAPIVEDVSLRVVYPELRERFDLRPLRGMLLVSYKPGMGKTTLARALARWLDDRGAELGFDFELYHVRPNELKSHWHGGDAKLVREDLFGAIRARQAAQPAGRPVFQLVVLDEIDALGARGGQGVETSSAHNDAVQALLAELDGLQPAEGGDAHVLFCGLTNRPDLLDGALKRPGRFGDLVAEMPDLTREGAAGVMAVHAARRPLTWHHEGEALQLASEEAREELLAPAIARVWDAACLRYSTDSRAGIAVTAGEALASVHFAEALNLAKKAAARRELLKVGVPAIRFDDVLAGLVHQACSAARQMEADRAMLARQLRIEGQVRLVQVVPEEELAASVGLATPLTGSLASPSHLRPSRAS